MKVIDEIISSRQNPLVKHIFSLHEKKGRERARSFIVEGEKLTFEAASSKLAVTHVIVREDKREQLLPRLLCTFDSEEYNETKLVTLSRDAFEKISSEKSPEGVISVVKYLDFFKELDIIYNVENYFPYNENIICLCSVRDPSNLGAIIRSAVAFGIRHIVLSSDCVDAYNPKALRASMGGLFKVNLTYVRDLGAFIQNAKASGRCVYAAELRDYAKGLDEVAFTEKDVIVIGNEGHGISEEISRLCTASVYIPISEATESLNASVAASIFMWELKKIRK